MAKEKEPLDSLGGAIANGIHLVATAVLCARGASAEELDLAGLILRRNPERSAPRESESTIDAFNRILDVAIESANDSAHCGTRAERRARLAEDLGRKGVVMIDHEALAALVDAKLELDKQALGLIAEAPGPVPLLEALEPEPCDHETQTTATTGDGVEVVTCLDCGEQLSIGSLPWPDDAIDYSPSSVSYAEEDIELVGSYSDPRVND